MGVHTWGLQILSLNQAWAPKRPSENGLMLESIHGRKKRDLHFQLGVSPGSCDCPRPRAPDVNVAQEGGDCRAPPQHPDVNVDFFLSLRSQQRLCGLASRTHRRSLAPTLKLGARGGKPRCEPVHTVISIWQSRFFLPCMDPQSNSNPKQKKNQYL